MHLEQVHTQNQDYQYREHEHEHEHEQEHEHKRGQESQCFVANSNGKEPEKGSLLNLPKTSRFFDNSSLPSIDKLELNFHNQGKPLLINGQKSGFTYNPHNNAQFCDPHLSPVNVDNLQTKFTITETSNTLRNEIPFFQLNEDLAKDPVALIDNSEDVGKQFGAIKVKLPYMNQKLIQSTCCIDFDAFKFKTQTLEIIPTEDEFYTRLRFLKQLSDIHENNAKANGNALSCKHISKSEQKIKRENMDINSDFDVANVLETSKKPIDLYKLFKLVTLNGGFTETNADDHFWTETCQTLGFGKDSSDKGTKNTNWLRLVYQKLLLPLENHLNEYHQQGHGLENHANEITIKTEIKNEIVIKNEISTKEDSGAETLSNGKHNIELILPLRNKRLKTESECVQSDAPLLITNSAKLFSRRLGAKVAKGFLTSSANDIVLRPPNAFTVENIDKPLKKSKRNANGINKKVYNTIKPQTELEFCLDYIESADDNNNGNDHSTLEARDSVNSIYTLRQFMEKDLTFQDYLVQNLTFFHKTEKGKHTISDKDFEILYWNYTQKKKQSMVATSVTPQLLLPLKPPLPSHLARQPATEDWLKRIKEVEAGIDLSTRVHGSGFCKPSEDLLAKKRLFSNSHAAKQPTHAAALTLPSNEEYLQAALFPWNLHNFSSLSNLILGILSEEDFLGPRLQEPRINIDMTFSIRNWTCEDQFTQLISYHHFGAPKKWIFIPESEFEKFEMLLEKVTREYRSLPSSSNIFPSSSINCYEPVTAQKLASILSKGENDAMSLAAFAIKHTHLTYSNSKRLPLKNEKLHAFMNQPAFQRNQDITITLDLLDSHNIKYTTSIQHQGEYIVKYPKTYSFSQSFGFNCTEEVNFASSIWLNYALEGEKWVTQQGILPNFLVFKLLASVATSYDSGEFISFNDQVFAKIAKLYETVLLRELQLRDQVRALKIKECGISFDDKELHDIVADDNLEFAFPTRIIVSDKKTNKESILMSMDTFLKHHAGDQDLFKDLHIEMQTYYSDDKIRSFSKIFGEYSVDFQSWLASFENIMSGELVKEQREEREKEQKQDSVSEQKSDGKESELSLKHYKQFLMEGEKIYSCISSTSLSTSESFDKEKFQRFKSHLLSLKSFIASATQFVEDCQNILSLKHQQRIRNVQDLSSGERLVSLHDLLKLVEEVPKLIFTCPEIDQLLELQNEVENFDKACQNLISKKNKSLQEIEDLINLGESFGLIIPSLEFLIRIRDRIKWIQIYNLIEKGVDPYADKKEVFTIDDLKLFHKEGLSILATQDLQRIKGIEKIYNESVIFEDQVGRFLHYNFVHDLDFEKLNAIIDDFTNKKLFISLNNYNNLSKIHANMKLIQQYKEKIFQHQLQLQYKHRYPELKQLYNSIMECGLKFDVVKIERILPLAEKWVEKTSRLFDKVKLYTTMRRKVNLDNVNQKLTMNGKLVENLLRVLQKAEFNLSPDDVYERSSSYLQSINSEENSNYYCLCREYENGTMVECESCNEWYHVPCVKTISDTNAEHYECPICLFFKSLQLGTQQEQGVIFLNQLNEEDLYSVYEEVRNLPCQPVNEVAILADLINLVTKFKQEFQHRLTWIKQEEMDLVAKLDVLRYEVRKLSGCGVHFKDFSQELIGMLKQTMGLIELQKQQKEQNTLGVEHPPPIAALVPEIAFNTLASMLADVTPSKNDFHQNSVAPILSSTQLDGATSQNLRVLNEDENKPQLIVNKRGTLGIDTKKKSSGNNRNSDCVSQELSFDDGGSGGVSGGVSGGGDGKNLYSNKVHDDGCSNSLGTEHEYKDDTAVVFSANGEPLDKHNRNQIQNQNHPMEAKIQQLVHDVYSDNNLEPSSNDITKNLNN